MGSFLVLLRDPHSLRLSGARRLRGSFAPALLLGQNSIHYGNKSERPPGGGRIRARRFENRRDAGDAGKTRRTVDSASSGFPCAPLRSLRPGGSHVLEDRQPVGLRAKPALWLRVFASLR